MDKKTRKAYTLQFKKEVILAYENTRNVSEIARRYKITRSTLQGWLASKDKIQCVSQNRSIHTKKVRLLPYKTEARHPELESALLAWIKEERSNGVLIRGQGIREKARQLFSVAYPGKDATEFKASMGWLARFLRRNSLVKRRAAFLRWKVPSNAPQLADFFLADMKKRICSYCLVANFAELPLRFDLPSSHVFDFQNVSTVRCKETGNEKLGFTVCLTVSYEPKTRTARKLLPMLIFPNLRNASSKNFPEEVAVTSTKGGVMTASVFVDQYLPACWELRTNAALDQTCLFLMDAAPAHLHEDVKKALKAQHMDAYYIARGMTSLVQPVDTRVKELVKGKVRASWEDWILSGEQQFARTGHKRHVSYDQVVKWVADAWGEVDNQEVKSAFEQNGLGLDMQGPEHLHAKLRDCIEKRVVPLESASDSDEFDEDEDTDAFRMVGPYSGIPGGKESDDDIGGDVPGMVDLPFVTH